MQNDAAVLIEQRLAKMQDELVTLLKTHLGDDPTHPLISRLTQQAPNVESLVADLSQEMNLTVYERELAQINDIAAARARIREGTFGICANCKSPINRKRPLRVHAPLACLRLVATDCSRVWNEFCIQPFHTMLKAEPWTLQTESFAPSCAAQPRHDHSAGRGPWRSLPFSSV
jgi:RNA polymerase-binding transcription factor DksA